MRDRARAFPEACRLHARPRPVRPLDARCRPSNPCAADDGYDYLKHMRVLGRGQANLEGVPATASADSDAAAGDAGAGHAAPGPSVFLPAPELEAPEDDVKVIDASRLTVMQAVEAEGDAAVMAGGVTAFSRARERVRRGEQRELAELEDAMRALEEAEELGDAGGGGRGGAGERCQVALGTPQRSCGQGPQRPASLAEEEASPGYGGLLKPPAWAQACGGRCACRGGPDACAAPAGLSAPSAVATAGLPDRRPRTP